MKFKSLLVLMLLWTAYSFSSLYASVEFKDKPSAELVSGAQQAAQAVANHYNVAVTAVQLGAMFNNNGDDAWPFKVPSLNKSGTVTLTSRGPIIIDELDGF